MPARSARGRRSPRTKKTATATAATAGRGQCGDGAREDQSRPDAGIGGEGFSGELAHPQEDNDAAFNDLAPESYARSDPGPDPNAPSRSSADAAALTRAALERSGAEVGKQTRLDTLISAVPPVHPAVRLLDYQYAQTFALTSVPNATIAAADCAARAQGGRWTGDLPLEYGEAFGMNLRFRTQSGEPPVLRVLWVKDQGAWRIRAYAVEYP